MELGLILFFITFVVLALSKVLLLRLRKRGGANEPGQPNRVCPQIPAVRPDADAVRTRLQASRRRMNVYALTASLAAMVFGLFWLAWILWTTISLGVGGLSLDLFTADDPGAQHRRRRPAPTPSSAAS